MHKLIVFFLTAVLTAFALVPARADKRADAARAEEVIKQARAALGGDEKLRAVEGLAVKGKFRRIMGEREMNGEREFDFLLPDKFLKEDSLYMPMGTSVTTQRGLNGSESWTTSGGGAGGGTVFIMGGPGGATVKPSKEQMEQANKMLTDMMRADMARYLLAFLLAPPQGFEVEFTYAGEAVAEDGRADTIDITGPEKFAARLFIDKETHLPLMLTYRGPKPRIVTMNQQQGGGKKREELLKEAQEKANKDMAEAKPEEAEFQMRFADYRKDGGILLPHRITQATDGEVSEEWEVKAFEINPQFKADKFQKK